jgi:formylglycine-generating enzyme required for sulfatase activity
MSTYRYPYKLNDRRENLEASDDIFRIQRGGAFFYNLRGVRCAFRLTSDPHFGFWDSGFRVVVRPAL